MACGIDEDIILSGVTASTDYRVMAQDAFGHRRISETLTSEVDTTLIVPLAFISDWIDLGAQITLTVLEDLTLEPVPLALPVGTPSDPEAPITCVLLIFATDGAVVIR
jgi:hypothetical protein